MVDPPAAAFPLQPRPGGASCGHDWGARSQAFGHRHGEVLAQCRQYKKVRARVERVFLSAEDWAGNGHPLQAQFACERFQFAGVATLWESVSWSASRTRSVAPTISGPMPSPRTNEILCVILRLSDLGTVLLRARTYKMARPMVKPSPWLLE